MSDTHGNLGLMHQAAEAMLERDKVGKIYHLGDTYQDSRKLLDYLVPVVAVPGIYEPEYTETLVEREVLEQVEGQNVLLVHDRTKIPPENPPWAHVVLYGHTHRYEAAEEEGSIFINPGHLKAAEDKGRKPGYAVLDITGSILKVGIFDLARNVLLDKEFIVCRKKEIRTDGYRGRCDET